MNTQKSDTHSGKKLIVLGSTAIAIMFIIYSRYQESSTFTPDASDSIQRIAYGFYIILLAAFGAISYGIYLYHRNKVERKGKDLFWN